MSHHHEKWTGHRALLVLHGHGEHGGRYFHFPHFVHTAVDLVQTVDHRGHGRSEGLRGHIEKFDHFAEDAALAIHRLDGQLKARFGKSEIHLLGHSLGGHVALRTLFLNKDLPLASATVSAPFLAIKVKVPVAKKFAAHALSRIWGSIQMGTGLDPSEISHDKEVVTAYVSDRLVHDKMTPSFFTSMLDAMGDTLKRDSGIEYPLQVLVPLQDRIVDSDVSLDFFRRLKHRDKRLKTYSGFYHEPFNELGKEQAFEDLVSWISSHSSGGQK
jgi:alpha-beta hydrolase superfamily lysophospholipase